MTNANHPLSKALAALGWSQNELARRSKVCQSTISFALNGKRGGKLSAESAWKIARSVNAALAARRRNGEKVPADLRALEDLAFPPSLRA